MNEIKTFKNAEFGSVRTLEINNEPYFVGKDVCSMFGDKNHNRSLGRIDVEDKTIMEITDNLGRKQNVIVINESGLYSLLFAMQPQKAHNGGVPDEYPIEVQERINKLHKFKRWVTSEVLPAIRRHGMYAMDELIENPDLAINALTALKEERERRKQLEIKVTEDKPKVLFADAVETAKTSILIGDLAKLIKQNGVDIGQKRLFEYMRKNGYLIKSGNSKNMPTQKSMELGLFEIKERTINNPDGTIRITKTSKVTGKGQTYFVNKFLGH